MDLLDSSTMSVEQKYMLMLQERVDSLTDELHSLKQYVDDTIMPPSYKQFPQLDKYMSVYKNNIIVQEKRCFARLYVKGSSAIKNITDYIVSHPDVDELVYYTNRADEIFCKDARGVMILAYHAEDGEECEHTFYDDDIYIIQAMITFTNRIYTAKYMAILFDRFKDSLYLRVSDVDDIEKTIVVLPLEKDEDFTTWVEFHMAAGAKQVHLHSVYLENIPFYRKEKVGSRDSLFWNSEKSYKKFYDGIDDMLDDAYMDHDLCNFEPLLPAHLTSKKRP